MRDTPLEIEMRMSAMFAERTPAERLCMATEMFGAGMALMKAGILQDNPAISEAEMRGMLFRRMYGDCFSAEECERIVEHLQRNTGNR